MTARRGRRRHPARRRVAIAMLAAAVIALGAWTVHSAREPGTWQRVLATREGDIGLMTSSRTVIRPDSMFVALPYPRALGRTVEVRYRDRASRSQYASSTFHGPTSSTGTTTARSR